MNTLMLFGSIGAPELLLLAVLGLLIFGRRLPEVGRSLGKGIVEFKKGLSGIEDDINKADATKQIPPNTTTTTETSNSETRTPQA